MDTIENTAIEILKENSKEKALTICDDCIALSMGLKSQYAFSEEEIRWLDERIDYWNKISQYINKYDSKGTN